MKLETIYLLLRLVDVISFDRKRARTCAATTLITQQISSNNSGEVSESNSWFINELWLACGSGFSQPPEQLHIVDVNKHGWQEHSTLNSDILQVRVEGESQQTTIESKCITSMCLVNKNAVWIGDNAGYIHAYRVGDQTPTEMFSLKDEEHDQVRGKYSLLFSYKMEPDAMEQPSPVRAIHFVPELKRVCVAMHNGRMFLCDADVIPSGIIGGEGSFVMTELGSSSCIHSVSSVIKTPPPTFSSTRAVSEHEHEQSSVEIWLVFSKMLVIITYLLSYLNFKHYISSIVPDVLQLVTIQSYKILGVVNLMGQLQYSH